MEINITKHAFKYGSQSYFRGNAIEIEIGVYGRKRDPVGAKAYIDVENKVKADHLVGRVQQDAVVDIDWNRTNGLDLGAEGLRFFGAKGEAAFSHEKAKTAQLKLVHFSIDAEPLKTMLNKDADAARKFLATEGKDGRIVSGVWVVMEAQMAETFSTSGSLGASVGGGGNAIALTARAGTSGAQTVTIGKGTTFAYRLHKVKDWEGGKERIKDLEADWKGPG